MLSNRLKERYAENKREREQTHSERVNKFTHGKFWYVWGYRNNGKPFLVACESQQEAEQKEYSLDARESHIVAYNTKDMAVVSRLVKAEIMNNTNSVDQALTRMSHKDNMSNSG